MPIFIIHALGQPPQKVRVDTPPVRVGREAGNDIVVHDKTVSRDHAMFLVDSAGRWVVSCVSDTNGVVVDGKLKAIVSIGDIVKGRIDELQTERDHLVGYIQQ